MKMRKLYEHLLRKLQASPPAKSSTPAAGPSSADSVDAGPVPDQEALNEEFILHLEPEPTSSLCQPPASSSSSLLPPASSSSSLLPPASSSPSLLFPASSSSSLLPPASSSPSLLPPASSSSSLLPPASSSPSPLPTFPSISTAYTSDVPNKKRTRKECRKHRTQKIFKYEEIVDRRVVNEKEVKVKWKPCSIWVVQAQYWLKMQSHLLLLKTLPLSLTICKHTCLSNAVHACY
ncbi:unnamed protein product [Oreochromis niloticus]|nr:unnamed protein product [Mustela putorius furo]